jgi:hypothetical protein
VGLFGQRFSRAAASERRRRSRSAALSFFGTPLARRPRVDAALVASMLQLRLSVAVCPAGAHGCYPARPVLCGLSHPTAQRLNVLGRHAVRVHCDGVTAHHAGPCHIPVDQILGAVGHTIQNQDRFAVTACRVLRRQLRSTDCRLHFVLPFCGVPRLTEDKVTDNRFTVNRENATIFQGCLTNMQCDRRQP